MIRLDYLMADVFILTYRVTTPHNLQNIQLKWAEKVELVVPGAPIILVGTHCDKKQGISVEQNSEVKVGEIAEQVGANQCFEVSAKDGTNVEELLQAAVKLGLEFREKKEAKARKKRCTLL